MECQCFYHCRLLDYSILLLLYRREKTLEVLWGDTGIKCVFPLMNAVIPVWCNCHFINSKPFLVSISERYISSKNTSFCSTVKFKFLLCVKVKLSILD